MTEPRMIFSAKFYVRSTTNGKYHGGKRNLTDDANTTLANMVRVGAFPTAHIQDAGHAYALWLDHATKINRATLSEPLRRILGRIDMDGALDVVLMDGTLTRYLLGPAAEFPQHEPRLSMDDKNVVAKLPAAAARRYLLTRMTNPAVPATPRATKQTAPAFCDAARRCAVILAALGLAITAAWRCCYNDDSSAADGYVSPDWWSTFASPYTFDTEP
jgi:hypothetical protein